MYDTTMRYMERNGNKLNKLYEQITSQQMINRPSDNPVGFTNALNYRSILNSLGQQKTNMDDGETYMTILETAHTSINNVFERCQELAVQASNDPLKHSDRLLINMEIRENLEQMVALAQTKHKDNYIFSGKWVDQPPYEIKNGEADYRMAQTTIDLNPAPLGNPDDPIFDPNQKITFQLFDSAYVDPNIRPIPDNPEVQRIIPGSVTGLAGLQEKAHLKPFDPNDPHSEMPEADYEIDYVNGTITLLSDKAKLAFYDDTTGNLKPLNQAPSMSFEYIYRNSIDMSGEIYREIDTGITMKINSNPDDLFGKSGQGQTDSFKEIIELMQGLWYNDQPTISKSIETLNVGRERNLEQQAVEGARLNRVGQVYDRNFDLTFANTSADSKIEDVKMEDALTQFSLADAVYNASLQAAARLMQRTVMDYL
jgi:flagellin-like hook-associated protein FlgL